MTNRMDNLTRDERLETTRPSRRNYITEQCCSVDDLRCHMSNLNPGTFEAKKHAITELNEAISYEIDHQNRITIVKMLLAKCLSIRKEIAPGLINFKSFQRVHGEWSDKTFGSRSPLGPLNHLLKEVNEAIEKPSNLMEYADCQLLLMDSVRLAGYTMDELYLVMLIKTDINKKRTWGKPDENGSVEHIRG